MSLVNVLGDVAGGGLLGLLGTGVSAVIGHFQAKQAHAHKIEEGRLQMELLKVTADVKSVEGEAIAFGESQKAEASIGPLQGWVGAFRAVTRPALTWFLVLAAIVLAILQTDQRAFLINSIGTLTVMAVTWWFGQRQITRLSK
jgi:hypothetical protein